MARIRFEITIIKERLPGALSIKKDPLDPA